MLTIPLPFTSLIKEYGGAMLSETVGTSFALLAISATLLLAAKGPSRRRCICLAAAVFVTILTRPAFLFLIALCPVSILLVSPSFRSGLSRWILLKEMAPNALATILPLVAYATFRFAAVGHFGLVSFGGVSLAGFATTPATLRADDVASLPTKEMRGLAQAIIDRRAEVAASNALTHVYPQYVFSEGAEKDLGQLRFWSESYDPSLWEVSIPATRLYYHAPAGQMLNPAWVKVNESLKELSTTILARRKMAYVRWLGLASQKAFRDVFHREVAGRWAIGLCFSLLVLGLVGRSFSGLIRANVRSMNFRRILGSLVGAIFLIGVIDFPDAANVTHGLAEMTKGTVLGTLFPLMIVVWGLISTFAKFWQVVRGNGATPSRFDPALGYASLAFQYFAGGLLLVVLVEVPWERYLVALSLLMPGAILLLCVKLVPVVFQRQNAAGHIE
ncbi:MAG: hypothetical protein ABI556_07935 [Gemmatimonadales bacterium]